MVIQINREVLVVIKCFEIGLVILKYILFCICCLQFVWATIFNNYPQLVMLFRVINIINTAQWIIRIIRLTESKMVKIVSKPLFFFLQTLKHEESGVTAKRFYYRVKNPEENVTEIAKN